MTPLVLRVGDTASLDFMVVLPSTGDTIYAAEFHLTGAGFLDTLRPFDAEPETPDFQLAVSDPFPGGLLVSSASTDNVLRYDATTGAFIDAFVPPGLGGLFSPVGLVFGPDGNLYVSSQTNARVLRYDGINGAFIDEFVSFGSGGLVGPTGLVFGPDGNLYLSSHNNDKVLRYDGITGAFIGEFVPAGTGGLDGPHGLVFGPDGNLYVNSRLNHQVLRYNGVTGALLDAFVSPGSGGLVGPTGLVFGPDGNLYVSSIISDQVLRYNAATGAFIDAFVPPGSGGLLQPQGLVFVPDGNLYVNSQTNSQVLRYDGATGIFIDAFVSPGSGGLNSPTGLTFMPGPPQSLALTGKERLNTVIIGFPDDGDLVRACTFDPTPQPGDDSIYDFIKGDTGGNTNVPLQLLDQHQRPEWGPNWCGPTAAGISLAWFAETASGDTASHSALIPHSGDITTADKFEAINTLGMFMQTSGDGTTDNNLVDGLETYIASRGLTGDFIIKVFNFPGFFPFRRELLAGEDVLVRIASGDGSSHWLVGRSFSDTLDTGDTPDTGDDFFPVSFVDPGTASVYHSGITPPGTRFPRGVLYNGVFMDFDLMVTVSPGPVVPNDDTAQYFMAQNDFRNFVFTLLGDPDPANTADHRTLPITGDAGGRVFLARFNFEAVGPGEATLTFDNPLGIGDAVKLVQIDASGDSVLMPDIMFGTLAAIIRVVTDEIEVRVKLQGPGRQDPEGFQVPLDVSLFARRTGDTDADVLNDVPADTFRCDKMSRGTGDDFTPRGVCVGTSDQIGTFDVAVKSSGTLLHVKRSVPLPGVIDFAGPAHDPVAEKGLHEGDLDENGKINILDFTLFLDDWRTGCLSPGAVMPDFPAGDFDKNCDVNITDFTIFLDNWSSCVFAPHCAATDVSAPRGLRSGR